MMQCFVPKSILYISLRKTKLNITIKFLASISNAIYHPIWPLNVKIKPHNVFCSRIFTFKQKWEIDLNAPYLRWKTLRRKVPAHMVPRNHLPTSHVQIPRLSSQLTSDSSARAGGTSTLDSSVEREPRPAWHSRIWVT